MGIFFTSSMGTAAKQVLTVIDENTGKVTTDAIAYASGGLQTTFCNTPLAH